jgi:hypothetical protein
MDNINLEEEYKNLETDRDVTYDRAIISSYYTINYLILQRESDKDTKLVDLYQSIGAYGVNNLANKLLLALLPPNKLFFNIELLEEVKKDLDEVQIKELEELLKKLEFTLLKEINNSGIRNIIFNAILNLIVAGNSLLYMNNEGKMRNFTIEEYVIDRDSFGNVLKIITKEIISYDALDEDIKNLVDTNLVKESTDSKQGLREYDLYSCIVLNNGKYDYFQSIGDLVLEDTKKTYKKEESPFIPLRWSVVRNESYGRSHVDLVIGDLKTLEEASEVIVTSAAVMSDIKFFVKPNSGINLKKLNDPNTKIGSFIAGDVNSIGALQVNKNYDLQILREEKQDIERRISKHFLLADGAQRNAERVTAEEIRMLTNELENTLGGVYSTLAEELQLPLVKLFINILEKLKKIPKTPLKFTDIKIKTGIEALGKNSEIVNLNQFFQQISIFGEQAISKINIDEVISRIGDNLGIDLNNLVKSNEQLQQEQQQIQEQQLIEKLGPGVVNEITKGMMNKGVNND